MLNLIASISLVDLISLDDRILFVLLSVSKGHMTQVMWRPISSQIYTGRERGWFRTSPTGRCTRWPCQLQCSCSAVQMDDPGKRVTATLEYCSVVFG